MKHQFLSTKQRVIYHIFRKTTVTPAQTFTFNVSILHSQCQLPTTYITFKFNRAGMMQSPYSRMSRRAALPTYSFRQPYAYKKAQILCLPHKTCANVRKENRIQQQKKYQNKTQGYCLLTQIMIQSLLCVADYLYVWQVSAASHNQAGRPPCLICTRSYAIWIL